LKQQVITNGNLTKQTDAKGKSSIFGYDNANRLTQMTNRLGQNTKYEYDLQDNLTKIKDANGGTTSFEYSPTGELEKQISANGKTETFSYRLDGQMTKNTKADGHAILYGYDELNRMVGKRMNNQDFVYDYDDNNELISAKVDNKFDLGSIENAEIKDKLNQSSVLTFERNAYGDITKSTTDKGEMVNYAYDAFGRQTEIKYPNGTQVKYEYDQKNQLTKVIDGQNVTSYTYDGLGRILSVTSPQGTKSTYDYLPTGEIKQAKTVDKNGKRLSEQQYEYDKNGNLIKELLIYPKFQLDKTYEYDDEDQLIKATEKESQTTRVTQYFYDNVGNRVATRLDVNGKFKGVQEWKNNADNQLTEITSEKGATFEYDKNGHISQKRSATGEVTIYQYDVEGRIIQESSTWGKQTVYTYDALGNRIAKGTATEYDCKLKTDMMSWMKATDREAQLRLSEESVTLKDILTKLVKMPEFISRCLPIKNRTWRIDHDANRRQVTEEKLKKAVDSTAMLEMVEYLNDCTQKYVSPLQTSFTTYDKKVKSSYQATNFYDNKGMAIGDDLDTYHQDGLMSTMTQVGKSTGSLYSSNLYKEFGQSERFINDQAGYRSQYHDNWQDIHLRAREYDTTTGRFTQQDTVLGSLTSPKTQNKYIYANNNPFMYRDDAGRWGWLSKAWNAVKSVAKKVVNTVVNVVKTVVNTVVNVVKSVVNAVGNFVSNVFHSAQQTYNQAVSYARQSVSYVSNQIQQGYNQAVDWVAVKAEQARVAYQQAVQVAQETRKKAEVRIRKMCEGASAVWDGVGKALDQVVKGNYSKNSSILGTIGEIAVGFIPIVGQVADARDMLQAVQSGDPKSIAAAAIGFIPGVGDVGKGLVKGSKEVTQQIAKETAQKGAKEAAQQAGKKADDVAKAVTDTGFSSKGYNPKPGERTFEGYVKDNVPLNKETALYTNSKDFNSVNGEASSQFKRYGSDSHGGVSPHVHQPERNVAPNGNIYGSVGSKTSNGGVTSPESKDIKQLYDYLNNGKYQK
jgi:RHS repeat-associated protein